MQLQDILYSQGFGTRRICAGLIQQGYVQVDVGEGLVTCNDALEGIDVHEGLQYSVQGVVWPYHAKAYVLLHKPAGYECATVRKKVRCKACKRWGAWTKIPRACWC